MGVSLNLADNKQVLFAANWQHSRRWDVEIEENGNAYAIEIVDGEPARFNSRKIAGSTHPSILKNKDDSYSIIFSQVLTRDHFFINSKEERRIVKPEQKAISLI